MGVEILLDKGEEIMDRRKLIVDTDIGSDIDDALCLGYLLRQPRCELMGILTCSSEPEKRAEIADSICRYMGKDIPIFPGRDMPLVGKQLQTKVHQYEVVRELPHRTDFQTDRAIDFLREMIETYPRQITILSVGILTNTGALLAAYPYLAPLIREISVMGGSFFPEAVSYNATEWNIVNDPVAAKIVFESGIPIRVVGLDVTLKLKTKCTDFIAGSHPDVMKAVVMNAEKFLERTNDMYFHDPLAAACLFDESVCSFRRGSVGVGLGSDWGRTYFEEDPAGNALVADSVDRERFFRHYNGIVDA